MTCPIRFRQAIVAALGVSWIMLGLTSSNIGLLPHQGWVLITTTSMAAYLAIEYLYGKTVE